MTAFRLLTRKELDEMVWNEPISRIAKGAWLL